MTDHACPICGSTDIGGHPKRHKDYTPDRGRRDIDYMRCNACRAAWDDHHYVRERTHEAHDIRDGDGNRPEWGTMPPRLCKRCEKTTVKWLWHDGKGPKQGTELLRYECTDCGAVWQETVNEADGKRVSWHTLAGKYL